MGKGAVILVKGEVELELVDSTVECSVAKDNNATPNPPS